MVFVSEFSAFANEPLLDFCLARQPVFKFMARRKSPAFGVKIGRLRNRRMTAFLGIRDRRRYRVVRKLRESRRFVDTLLGHYIAYHCECSAFIFTSLLHFTLVARSTQLGEIALFYVIVRR